MYSGYINNMVRLLTNITNSHQLNKYLCMNFYGGSLRVFCVNRILKINAYVTCCIPELTQRTQIHPLLV